jgi:hypothetical protein
MSSEKISPFENSGEAIRQRIWRLGFDYAAAICLP